MILFVALWTPIARNSIQCQFNIRFHNGGCNKTPRFIFQGFLDFGHGTLLLFQSDD